MLRPITYDDPFDCSILPPPFDSQCRAQKGLKTEPGSCARLPLEFQQFCLALPPQDPSRDGLMLLDGANDYDPRRWPQTAASDLSPQNKISFQERVRFGNARRECGQEAGPRGFYNCLWNTMSPSQQQHQPYLVNTSHVPCPSPTCYPKPCNNGALTNEWKQVAPTNTNLTKGSGMAEPLVWKRR